MRLPELTEYPISKDMLEEFKGLNKNLRTEPSQWNAQKNMTTDFYPVASPRGKRSLQERNDIEEWYLISEPLYVEDARGVLYFDSTMYFLDKIKKKTFQKEHLGYWFYANNTPLNNFVHSIVETISGVSVTDSYDYETHTDTIEFSNLTSVKYSVGNAINFSYTVNHTWCRGIGYIVTSVTNNSFVCEKVYTGGVDIMLEGTNIDVDFSKTEDEELFFRVANYFDTSDDSYRNVIRMGANICVFPDGVVYETTNTSDNVPIYKVAQEIVENEIMFKTVIESSESEDGYQTINGETDYRLQDGQVQKYIGDSALWVGAQTYVKIIAKAGTFDKFSIGDSIILKIESDDGLGDGDFADVTALHGILGYDFQSEQFTEHTIKILKKGSEETTENNESVVYDYLIVNGFVGCSYISAGPGFSFNFDFADVDFSFKRKKPNIKYACECQNRIWACSEDGHEIYASALGNPYNFYDFSGLTTDSYAVNVGTDGEFTACYNYLGNPIFFKENSAHIIQGAYPTNLGQLDGGSYAVSELTNFNGVEKGSEKSLVIIDNILFYKSAIGIVAFDGTNTSLISDALGKEKYKNAVAGAYKSKYYVSMEDSKGIYHMFVYDVALGTWCEEDNTQALDFVKVNNELLYLDLDGDVVCSVCEEDVLGNSEYSVEEDFEWECETGNFGYSYPNNKYVSRFQIRMQLTDGATASFYVQYDSNGVWERKAEITGKGTKTHLIPIIPVRCDHMKFKITGKGDAKIYSIAKIIEEGGDVV